MGLSSLGISPNRYDKTSFSADLMHVKQGALLWHLIHGSLTSGFRFCEEWTMACHPRHTTAHDLSNPCE